MGAIPVAMAGRTPRPHRAHSRYLCKLRDWAHSQSYAAVFQLYAISGRAHFRHRPMQLRTVHRGRAHSQAFGGNVSAFNAKPPRKRLRDLPGWSGPMAIAGILPLTLINAVHTAEQEWAKRKRRVRVYQV